MKLIDSSASLIDELDAFRKIELIGRTCYKSEKSITEDSRFKFVSNLIQHRHFAMLEHSTVTYLILKDAPERLKDRLIKFSMMNKAVVLTCVDEFDSYVLTVSLSHLFRDDVYDSDLIKMLSYLFFTSRYPYMQESSFLLNYFSSEENSEEADLLPYIIILPDSIEEVGCEEEYKKMLYKRHKFFTFKFICDRGVSHELVRHRCSFAQESTRYCNYSQAKFGEEITYIKPYKYDEWSDSAKKDLEASLEESQFYYMALLKNTDQKITPQQARAVLPNALKTEVIMTASVEQWLHFFNLRSLGTTGAPHPDMKKVADEAYEIFKKVVMKGIVEE